MRLEKLVSKYIASAEHAIKELEIVKNSSIPENIISKVVDFAKAYLEDAKYYRDKKKYEVSLTSVAYCEGLLDALRLLGAVKFEWLTKERKRRK